MAINEEIARLTGTLAFNVDSTGLTKFEAKLAGVEVKMKAFAAVAGHKFQMSGDLTGLTTFASKLADVQAKIKEFSALANQKHTIGVKLDAAGLKASIDKAANTKFRFNNVSVARDALDRVVASVVDRLARVPVYVKNVKIDMSAVLAQREALRKSLEHVSVAVNVVLKMNNATTKLRAWKKTTEDKFKLYLNADISGAKLYRNAAKTLRDIGARLGTFKVKSPMIKLTVDRAALRAEIASVLEQIKREVKIKIDLNSRVSGNPSRGAGGGHAGAAFGGGLVGGGMGFMRGLIPGLGAAYAVSKLNQINQQMQGQDLALTAVTGSKENGQAAKKRLRAMADDIGFNARELTPAFTKMIASGEASGFGQAKSEKVFKSMAEYGRVMGLSSEDMKGSMRAVEQMMNKGQIMSEELKGQLGERFPAAIALFAKSQKMSIPELFKAMEKGLVKSDALEAFAETLAKEARRGGALEASKKSTAAEQQRMGNGISDSIASFSEGGFDAATARFFKTVADGLAKSQPMIKSLGLAFEVLMTPINATIKLLGELAKAWPDIAKSMGLTSGQFSALAVTAGIFLLPLGSIIIGLGLLAVALEDIVSYNKGEDSIFGKLLKGLDDDKLLSILMLGEAFTQATEAISGMGTAIGELFGIMNKEGNMELFKEGAGMYFDLIIEKVTNALNMVKNLADLISKVAKGDFEGAMEPLKNYGADLIHNTPLQWILKPEYQEAVEDRYNAQKTGLGESMKSRELTRRDDVERGKTMMGAAKDGAVASTVAPVFTGPITLSFPNALVDPSDKEMIWDRVLSKALNKTNVDLGTETE